MLKTRIKRIVFMLERFFGTTKIGYFQILANYFMVFFIFVPK